MRAGSKCLVVSHANTLRTLIKHIDGISDEGVKALSIPTGIPILYRLDRNLQPVDPFEQTRYMVEPRGYIWETSRNCGFTGSFLGSSERFAQIHKKKDTKHRDWQRVILLKLLSKVVSDDIQDVDSGSEEQQISTIELFEKLDYKMLEQPEYSKMHLLRQMKGELRELAKTNRHVTRVEYEAIVDRLYEENDGKVVDTFVPIKNVLLDEDDWYGEQVADRR